VAVLHVIVLTPPEFEMELIVAVDISGGAEMNIGEVQVIKPAWVIP
jgi:hypothetical protein